MGCEGMSPSSHWKITIAFSVVLDTSPSTLALEGIAGAPQSAVENSSQSCPAHTSSLTYALMLCWIRCPQAIAGTHCCHITLRLEPWTTVIHNLSSFISGREGNDGAIHGRQGSGTASCRERGYNRDHHMSEDARFTLILGAAVVIRENAKKKKKQQQGNLV